MTELLKKRMTELEKQLTDIQMNNQAEALSNQRPKTSHQNPIKPGRKQSQEWQDDRKRSTRREREDLLGMQ